MEDSTLAPGRTTTCMVMVSIPGRMVAATRATMRWTRNMDTVYISGRMVGATRGTGSMASSTVKANIFFQTVVSRLESGTKESVYNGLTNDNVFYKT